MKQHELDLATLKWSLSGTIPYAWQNAVSIETGVKTAPEIGPIEASVPGSIQKALIDAQIIPDWRYDLNHRLIEWLEHRHWVYSCQIPNEYLSEGTYKLTCEGLDYSGWVYYNSTLIGTFENSFISHTFNFEYDPIAQENWIQIIFNEPPRWLGQIGFTSQIKHWKPRFNYGWDWIPRVVQTGISGAITLKKSSLATIDLFSVDTLYNMEHNKGELMVNGVVDSDPLPKEISICAEISSLKWQKEFSVDSEGHFSFRVDDLVVEPWYPNGFGEHPVYHLHLSLKDREQTLYTTVIQIGFKSVTWNENEGAPEGATPWICTINGKRVFLQGVNWTPISPTFADVTKEEIKKRLLLYKEMGCNILRVWGGAVLESREFYEECDSLGLMVWQELPLSSSGLDNWPPEDPTIIDEISLIAKHYIKKRKNHVSLLMYSGGNELQGSLDGKKSGVGKPIDFSHPMMVALKEVFDKYDNNRRFIPTSPFGPRFKGDIEEFGKKIHWSTHGPWNVDGVLDQRWQEYWSKDDSLLRAETGAPGVMNLELLKKYIKNLDLLPIDKTNPLWGRTSWWIESQVFEEEFGHKPETAQEYFEWSEKRQAQALKIAVTKSKEKFPRCGGIIIWMGHDCYPCAANTSLIDIDGNPKPAYYELKKVFTEAIED